MNLLNWERINTYSWIFLVVYVVVTVGMVLTGPGLTDRRGLPKGTDYVGFYAAASLARSGQPADAYDPRIIQSLENNIIHSDFTPFTWNYPPTFQLALLPLAYLPYLYSLLVWLGFTLGAYLLVVRKFAPHPITTRLLLAYPGTFQCALQGQNGFLTATLMGGGLLLLETHPIAAGAVLGLLSYKPQLAWLTFVALAAGKYWKALAASVCSAICLAGASLQILGSDTWLAFFDNLRFISKSSASGMYPLFKMPTMFASARLLGIGVPMALILQSAVMALAVAGVVWVWSGKSPLALRVSVLIVGTLLAFPFMYDYDLAILAIALACVAWNGHTKGWVHGEKTVIALCWALPLISTVLAKLTNVQISPIVLIALFAFLVKRIPRGTEALM